VAGYVCVNDVSARDLQFADGQWTPGVGFTREPPVYLRPGDEVSVEVDGIGALVNPVVAAIE